MNLRGVVLGIVIALSACSAPQLAYNNADSLLRFKLYGYFDPTQQQDIMMSDAIQRLHAWHRRNELPGYAGAFAQMAQRVENGLQEADITWSSDLTRERYRRLAARAVEEALPIVRTLNDDNFAALESKFADRNKEYADDFLSGDEAEQREAMVDNLEEHLERWIDSLTGEQRTLLTRFVASQPRFAALRLENRKHLQKQMLATLRQVARGQTTAENTLRDIAVHWEKYSTPQYRQALAEWERGMARTLVAINRSLTATQRSEAVTRLRQYSSDLYALTDGNVNGAATARAGAVARTTR